MEHVKHDERTPRASRKARRAPVVKTPKTRFEAFRINNRISVTRLHRAAVVSPRTVDLMRQGNNTTVDSIRSMVKTMSDLLEREVTASELFDLSGAHQSRKIIASFDLPGTKKNRGDWDRKRRMSDGLRKVAKRVGRGKREKSKRAVKAAARTSAASIANSK